MVLDAPLERLEAAAATTRDRRRPGWARVAPHRLWRLPTAADLLAALEHAAIHDLPDLARA